MFGSGTDTRWLATMDAVCSNHHAESWFSTWPFDGTVAMIRSNADSRSVVTNSRWVSDNRYETRTLPSRRSGRSRCTSSSVGARSVVMSAVPGMGDAAFEQLQAERALVTAGVTRVLASDDVVLGVRHQTQHDTAGVAHTGDRRGAAVGVGRVAKRHLT